MEPFASHASENFHVTHTTNRAIFNHKPCSLSIFPDINQTRFCCLIFYMIIYYLFLLKWKQYFSYIYIYVVTYEARYNISYANLKVPISPQRIPTYYAEEDSRKIYVDCFVYIPSVLFVYVCECSD